MDKIRILLMAVVAMISMTVLAEDEKSIVEREYWFDNDVSTLQTLDAVTTAVDISALSQGLHSFTIRVKDSKGFWSCPMTKYFVVKPTPTTTTVAACEYWFDNDVANSKTLGESVATVEMSGLNQGLHAFTMRVKNDAGVWSSTMTKYFLVPADAFMENGLAVSHYMYWIDESEVVSGMLSSADDIITVDLSSVEAGEHVLTWMVGDSKGAWSQVYTEPFIYDPSMITTGVDDVEADSRKDVYYDLQGRKINKPVKGLYIVNGKIVIK
ncbi:MAG: hypothetical protein J6Z10_05260 [Prevotella sp.]|nr:hypothetical protein [Prevotella sp.]